MQEYDEEEFLLLSGIQHFNFCRRQWALIHIEQQWQENVLTLEGTYVHERVDNPFIREKRTNKLVVRAMPVQSRRLGVTGICDVVEFVRDPVGIELAGEEGRFVAVPVEYKRGRPKTDESDRAQLVAQLLCLEDMLECELSLGYLFYAEIKRRVEVHVTPEDKAQARNIILEMHQYFQRNYTPKVKFGPKCKSCSLYGICLPELQQRRSVASYIESRITE
jgi:CRISPR-associated exonuclease Cas4